jgi:hypothetical protein
MKNRIAASWTGALALVFFILCILTSDANAQQIFSRAPSLRNLAADLSTPEAVANYMWHNFTFEKDRRQFGSDDYWQTPDQFVKTRQGDCEDFALFAYEILKLNGRKAFILNVYGGGFAHSVCVYLENGRYNMINGANLERLNAKDLKAVADEIYPFWQQALVISPSQDHTGAKVLKKLSR